MDSSDSKPKIVWYRRLIGGTGLYGLELILATLGLIVTSGFLTFGIYALFNYMAGVDNSAQYFMGDFSIWLVAGMVAWLPLTVFFYLRTRGEVLNHPEREDVLLHKLIVGLYRFHFILLIVGTLFVSVYAAFRLLVDVDASVGDTMVRIVLPGVIAAMVNAGLVMAYNRSQKPSRKLFTILLTAVSLIIMITLLIVSVSYVRSRSADNRTVNDLAAIETTIGSYASAKDGELPNSLTQLDDLSKDIKDRLEDYSYTKVSRSRYQICAKFTNDTMSEAYKNYNDDDYTSFGNYSVHPKGEHCFKLEPYYATDMPSKMNGIDDEMSEETTLY